MNRRDGRSDRRSVFSLDALEWSAIVRAKLVSRGEFAEPLLYRLNTVYVDVGCVERGEAYVSMM